MAEHTQLEHDAAVRQAGGFSSRHYDAQVHQPSVTMGQHTLSSLLGVVSVEFCEACGKQVAAVCTHAQCAWDSAGQVLSCKLCGIDCT